MSNELSIIKIESPFTRKDLVVTGAVGALCTLALSYFSQKVKKIAKPLLTTSGMIALAGVYLHHKGHTSLGETVVTIKENNIFQRLQGSAFVDKLKQYDEKAAAKSLQTFGFQAPQGKSIDPNALIELFEKNKGSILEKYPQEVIPKYTFYSIGKEDHWVNQRNTPKDVLKYFIVSFDSTKEGIQEIFKILSSEDQNRLAMELHSILAEDKDNVLHPVFGHPSGEIILYDPECDKNLTVTGITFHKHKKQSSFFEECDKKNLSLKHTSPFSNYYRYNYIF
ncbi:MAG: hypothetical protein JSR80_02870 [Verrucomicrobia bacterium]|nr:hypothetical protein [Verrucomicrobiota bacterium]